MATFHSVVSHLRDLKQSLADEEETSAKEVVQWFRTTLIPAPVRAAMKLELVFKRLTSAHVVPASVRRGAAQAVEVWRRQDKRALELAQAASRVSPVQQLATELDSKLPATELYADCGYEYSAGASFNSDRVRRLQKKAKDKLGPVIYWMQRDQRMQDNFALLYAQRRAISKLQPLVVVVTLDPADRQSARKMGFMLRGLREVEADLAAKGIQFRLLLGDPATQLAAYSAAIGAMAVVADFSPLRQHQHAKDELLALLEPGVMLAYVDAHNVVPVWCASDKPEAGARTLRTKIHRQMTEFFTDFEQVIGHPDALPADADASFPVAEILHRSVPQPADGHPPVSGVAPRLQSGLTDWRGVMRVLDVDWQIGQVGYVRPGERAAATALQTFLMNRINEYQLKRFDANKPGALSLLSPYLHFGQLSAHRVLLELCRMCRVSVDDLLVKSSADRDSGAAAFADELLVHKELADNFCFYSRHGYDNHDGFPEWARRSFLAHEQDVRDERYDFETLQRGGTSNQLWNATHAELVATGKISGYARVYWAKQLLRWTESSEQALAFANKLNDKYALDSEDPIGYTSIASCIGGVHEQATADNPVWGKVRMVDEETCSKRFDVATYISRQQMPKAVSDPGYGAVFGLGEAAE